MTGFEMGAIPMTLMGTPDVVAANARTGVYALRLDASTEGAYFNLGISVTELCARVAFRPIAIDDTRTQMIVQLANSESEPMLALGMAPNTLDLKIYRNDGNWVEIDAGPTLVLNTWYVFEIHLTAPDNASGAFQVKVDGALDIDFLGDTLGTQTPADFRYLYLGCSTTATPRHRAARGLYDDIAVNDTAGVVNNSWPGRGGIEALVPTGAGATTGLTPSAGANWDCVEEVPASDANYVGAETVDLFDTYGLSDTVQSGGVPAVCIWLRAALAEAGAGNVATMQRSGGADYTGDDKGIDTTYRYVSQIYEKNPATSAPWTTVELDALEAGAKVR